MARPFRDCKALGHRFDEIPTPAEVSTTFRGGEVWVFRCLACMTTRWDRRNRMTGALEARRYDYPDGYAYAEKVTRAQLWREKAAERRSKTGRRAKKRAA